MATRRSAALALRQEAAQIAFHRPHPRHFANGEESSYRSPNPPPPPLDHLSYIANYSKGLPHDGLGEVDPSAYRALLNALASHDPDTFERIPLGTAAPPGRKLVNPQAGLSFELEGPDAQAPTMPPAPRFDRPEVSGEMAELYWMALLRDVNFTDYGTNAGTDVGPTTTSDAANSLSNDFSDFRGPRDPATGTVTPATLFRGFTTGDLRGPFVSQFLLKPIPFGTLRIGQRQLTTLAGDDYMMNFAEWLAIQNGDQPAGLGRFDPTRRYIRNARDLATYVHFDALYEAYLNACLILLGLQAPLDPGNFYADSRTQQGFGTFGGPHILSLVTEVATRALKAVWFQKWFVHRRLRPEAFGGLIHNQVTGAANYPIDVEILSAGTGTVLDRAHDSNLARMPPQDTFLLPQAFSEGSPLHPSYGAGHATVAGACVTILKAWFDESFVITDPVVPNAAGTALVPYVGGDVLTVGGELNKVAANVAIGRNMAGVHWRSDYTESVRLGEAIAIGVLEEQRLCYSEPYSLTLTRFDGRAISV
jgi:hypothetical protein